MRRRSRRALIAAVLAGLVAAAVTAAALPPAPPGLIGSFRWQGPDRRLGGISASDFTDAGAHFVALNDRGSATAGRILRDAAGAIAGIEARPFRLLRGNGRLPLLPIRRDSEGIALAPDGIYVSFEGAGSARLRRYRDIFGPGEDLPAPAAFRNLAPNAALEAVAAGPDGAIYTLPERAEGDYPVWRLRGGVWERAFTLPRRGAFRAVGADFGPDGRLYLLERRFLGPFGFMTRLRRFDLGAAGPTGETVLLVTPPGLHGNLEGLAVWRGPRGLVATMVADDNFLPVMATRIVEYRLPD